jgi:isochorismate synthase EntC
MVQQGGTVQAYAGGAVVADSICADEYREIEAKASGMLTALGCTGWQTAVGS